MPERRSGTRDVHRLSGSFKTPMPSWWLWAMDHGKEDRMNSVHKTTEEILAGIRDPELRQAAADLKKAMDNNPRDVPEDISEPQTAKIIQLPPWQEAKRGVPNSILRGALFAAVQSKHRVALNRQLLEATQDIEIRFTGWQLGQSDLDVWEQTLHLARLEPLGTPCYFTAHGFLQSLERKTGGSQHEQLKEEFARLGGAFVEITHGRITYGGSLLELIRDEDDGRYMLKINPKIAALYSAGWTATDWKQRLQLKGKPLALWLHGYYSTHAAPHPVRTETLMRLCGSRTKRVKHFAANLKTALENLVDTGAINEFEIRNGLVFVDNAPSDSQKRHLSRSKSRRQ